MRVYDNKKFWTAVWGKKDYPCRIAGFIKKYDLQEAIGTTVLFIGCGHTQSRRILVLDIDLDVRSSICVFSPSILNVDFESRVKR